MTDDVEEYIINHAFHKPLEAEFGHDEYLKRIQGGVYWLKHSATREELVSEELTDKDWESMACAVTTDSVACRFNPHPPPPMLFFTNGSGQVTTCLDHVKLYYNVVLPGIIVENIVFFLR
jgi:hypothetical protein